MSSPMKSSKEPQHITPEERLEQALFIGRAGRALMLHSTQLKRIFTVPKAVQGKMKIVHHGREEYGLTIT